MNNSQQISIYAHIPYCRNRCSYCDFVTFEDGSTLDSKEYIKVLSQEIKSQSQFFKDCSVKTIYFGGGTPSLIPTQQIVSALQTIKDNYVIEDDAEITIEINPGTLSDEKLKTYKNASINRFSLGVQTFNSWFLDKSGRAHSVEDSLIDLKRLQTQSDNFSLDLMFGLPFQNLSDLKIDVFQSLLFKPQHVSLYNLTVPAKHDLAKSRGSEEEQIEMFQWIEKSFLEKGLEKYEISNFAKPGFYSKHNMAYWRGGTVIAFGISAHSYLKPQFLDKDQNLYGTRFWNSSNMKTYLSQATLKKSKTPFNHLKKSQAEILNPFESVTDFFYTRLRTKKGLDFNEMTRLYPKDLCLYATNKFYDLQEKGFLTKQGDVFNLTDKGQILSNQVFLDLAIDRKDFNFLENSL